MEEKIIIYINGKPVEHVCQNESKDLWVPADQPRPQQNQPATQPAPQEKKPSAHKTNFGPGPF